MREAPLAAGVLHDEGGAGPGGELPPAATRGRSQVPPGATAQTPQQITEQVARKEHVDPGVAATVEAGQQHGDDEGRV